ncbi:putative wall-associated receptor kinase-like 16 isoform X1 [Gastrolobium bilobum]|uniref:putative wall-associated receptor kinase-like 16 isoform X1 n=1 Tax=Gastrolobium bilobum TaxID=150636 RepID=UPI002AB11379|nr:putative wall-associated receptor kinase-like 16 isoform X1 [Gastrolobium bilobum]
MELKQKHTKLGKVLMVALALLVSSSVAADQALPPPPNQTLPGCNDTCGDVKIPYPFGTGMSSTPDHKPCFLDGRFNLTCNNSTLYLSNFPVLNISVQGQMEVLVYVSSICYSQDGNSNWNHPTQKFAKFSISKEENKFHTVGCNSYGFLNSFYNGEEYSTGCSSKCYGNKREIHNGTCYGIGCCQVDIPPSMRNISIEAKSFSDSTKYWGNCSYSFVVKDGYYTFDTSHLYAFPYEMLPMVVDWTVGNQGCDASKSGVDYACMNNTYCYDKDTDLGYRCICNEGYEGNPYHSDGCRDIDECKTSKNTCLSENNCHNTDGSFKCFCPKGQSGDGTKDGGCHRRDIVTKVVIGTGAGFIVLIVGISSLYLIYEKRKLIKLKEKFFKQNGGIILQQRLSAGENTSQSTTVFSAEQLKKATNNYDESLIIGRGGYGIVYKGVLSDKRIVAIKKSKIVDQSQIEQFINEVIVLSQINHRNVVKLLGCCLETEVPSLVYEFVNNGTLFDYIHNEGKAGNVSWKTRLRIAAEAAGALSYLHSAASIPIIHRDVKTANILLDDTYTAKVSDFGASRLVPLDQTELATLVQGTLGYLDPEYMQTSQLTQKSDVYSFGVVLVELLTGEKPLCFKRPEEERSLAMHFLSCLKEDRMFEVFQVGILNEENKEEIKEVAILATKCLRLIGEERPSMKEVAMELEGLRLMEKHSWTNEEVNLEETHYLLHEASSSIHEHGDNSHHQNTGYDSIRDHELIAFDDGR